MAFEIRTNQAPQFFTIGDEQTPIFILDNFLTDTSSAINEGIKASYDHKKVLNTYYPGIRANVGEQYGMTVLRYCAFVLYNFFKVPKDLTLYPLDGSFSLITKQPHDLDLLSCIPHYDNVEKFTFAVLHYLNPGNFGGTGFYRHKPTGYETINTSRRANYLAQAQKFIEQNGNPKQNYFNDSDAHYELIHKIEYKPNRLAIYPANLLHSAYIDNIDNNVDDDPRTGRLTSNFFIEFN